jgi:hypothetical protein
MQIAVKDFKGRKVIVLPPSFEAQNAIVFAFDADKHTEEQHRKIFALVNDIALWYGETPEYTRWMLQLLFCAETEQESFSLSWDAENCLSKANASKFVDYMVRLVIEQGIPSPDLLTQKTEDIGKALYYSLVNKKCAVCGQKAEFHHENAVGAGRNRKEICHIGMKGIPLCRKHHSECHTIGQQSFNEKYHIFGITVNEKIAEVYHLGKAKKSC